MEIILFTLAGIQALKTGGHLKPTGLALYMPADNTGSAGCYDGIHQPASAGGHRP